FDSLRPLQNPRTVAITCRSTVDLTFLTFPTTFPTYRSRHVFALPHGAPDVVRRPCATSRSSRAHSGPWSKLVYDRLPTGAGRDRRQHRRLPICRQLAHPCSTHDPERRRSEQWSATHEYRRAPHKDAQPVHR